MHFEEEKIPRLQFLKPPTKHSPEKPGMVTPPLHTSATIPFVWEEKPGKPIPCTSLVSFSNPIATPNKSLELPPKLLFDHANITKLPSPTTVLDGPNMYGSLSAEREQLGTMVKDLNVKKHVFSSFIDKGTKDHIGSSSSIRVSHHKNVRMKRVKHCRSFITKPFHAKSLVWTKICEGWKRVVPPLQWRSEKLKKYRCWWH